MFARTSRAFLIFFGRQLLVNHSCIRKPASIVERLCRVPPSGSIAPLRSATRLRGPFQSGLMPLLMQGGVNLTNFERSYSTGVMTILKSGFS